MFKSSLIFSILIVLFSSCHASKKVVSKSDNLVIRPTSEIVVDAFFYEHVETIVVQTYFQLEENVSHSLLLNGDNFESRFTGIAENFEGYSLITFHIPGDDYSQFVEEFDILILSITIKRL